MRVVQLRRERLVNEIRKVRLQVSLGPDAILNLLNSHRIVYLPRTFHSRNRLREEPQRDFPLLKLEQLYGIIRSATHKLKIGLIPFRAKWKNGCTTLNSVPSGRTARSQASSTSSPTSSSCRSKIRWKSSTRDRPRPACSRPQSYSVSSYFSYAPVTRSSGQTIS